MTAPAAPSDAELCVRLREPEAWLALRDTKHWGSEINDYSDAPQDAAARIEALAAQLAEREAEIAAERGLRTVSWQSLIDRAEAAEARAAAAERDAARYRWLRNAQAQTARNWIVINNKNQYGADELDAAIDAALAGGSETDKKRER